MDLERNRHVRGSSHFLPTARNRSRRATLQLELPFDRLEEKGEGDLRARIEKLTNELLTVARGRWREIHFPEIALDFSLRGHGAGEARPETNTARYNRDLLVRYGDEFVREIVPHEVAHLVVAKVWGSRAKPHGREWRSVMGLFGASGSVTHRFQTCPARTVARVAYRCRCNEPHWLTKRAHLRIRRRSWEYRCARCGEVLVYVA
jgi:SprT protein